MLRVSLFLEIAFLNYTNFVARFHFKKKGLSVFYNKVPDNHHTSLLLQSSKYKSTIRHVADQLWTQERYHYDRDTPRHVASARSRTKTTGAFIRRNGSRESRINLLRRTKLPIRHLDIRAALSKTFSLMIETLGRQPLLIPSHPTQQLETKEKKMIKLRLGKTRK